MIVPTSPSARIKSRTASIVAICLAIQPVLCVPVLAYVAPTSGTTYVNERYGYSMSYPAGLFVAEREADDGDGRKFHAKHGDADMLVFGSNSALGQTPSDMAADAAQTCGRQPVTYRVVKSGLVAISCVTDDHKIFYHKALIHGDVITTFEMNYPASEQARWNPVCASVAGSLHAGREE